MQPLSDPRDTDVTFGTPGDNVPFSFSMHDLFRLDDTAMAGIDKVNNPDLAAINASVADFVPTVQAAERQTRLVDTINAHNNALIEAADNRIETARRLFGVTLENPFNGGYELDARDRLGVPITGASPDDLARVPQAQRDIFNEKMDELAQQHPDKAAGLSFGQSLDDQARAISAGAEYDGAHATGGFVAQLVGGLIGSRRDPLFIASLFAGPGEAIAKTALGRIGMGAIKQGLFNAGLQAVAQPAVQSWRADIGARNGVAPSLENVGLAFLFGAIPGAGIEGVKVLAAADKAAVARLADGTAQPGDVEAAARAVGVKLPDDTLQTVRAAERDIGHDALANADRPGGLPPQATADQALRHAEDPANVPPAAVASPPVAKPDIAGAEARLAVTHDPVAAVESLRADPALIEGALHSDRPDVVAAGRLASLSDAAYAMVRDGEARPDHGVIAAEHSPDPDLDAAVLSRLAEARPATPVEARMIAADVIEGESRRLQAAAQAEPRGFTPSQMRGLLSEEDEQIVNMWHQVREPIAADASDFHRSTVAAMKRDLERDGFARARTEDELRDILIDRRLSGVQPKATRPESIEGEILPSEPHSLSTPASWVIRNKESREVIMETFDPAKVAALNTEKYEAVPILEYLGGLNRDNRPAAPEASDIAMPDGTRRDAMELVPLERGDGTVLLATPESLAAMGDHEDGLSNFVKGCNP